MAISSRSVTDSLLLSNYVWKGKVSAALNLFSNVALYTVYIISQCLMQDFRMKTSNKFNKNLQPLGYFMYTCTYNVNQERIGILFSCTHLKENTTHILPEGVVPRA